MKTDKISQAVTTQRAKNDTNGTSVVEANQNTTNVNGKKIYCQQKLIICEMCFVH
jgi:hypothetical protein